MRVSVASSDRFSTSSKHNVAFHNTLLWFLKLLVRRVASLHQYMGHLNSVIATWKMLFEGQSCHLLDKVDHEEPTEDPDFSQRPTLKFTAAAKHQKCLF